MTCIVISLSLVVSENNKRGKKRIRFRGRIPDVDVRVSLYYLSVHTYSFLGNLDSINLRHLSGLFVREDDYGFIQFHL